MRQGLRSLQCRRTWRTRRYPLRRRNRGHARHCSVPSADVSPHARHHSSVLCHCHAPLHTALCRDLPASFIRGPGSPRSTPRHDLATSDTVHPDRLPVPRSRPARPPNRIRSPGSSRAAPPGAALTVQPERRVRHHPEPETPAGPSLDFAETASPRAISHAGPVSGRFRAILRGGP